MRYPIAPIEEWLTSTYFLGETAKNLYPYWRDVLIRLHKSGAHNLILTGATRNGKTVMGGIWALRILYEIGADEDFCSKFGLMSSTIPKLYALSYSATKSNSTVIKRINRIIDTSPFFQQHARRRKVERSTVLPWAEIHSHADITGFQGEDTILTLLDESELRNVSQARVVQDTQNLYFEMRQRYALSFVKNGKSYGYSVLISQAETENSFIDSEIKLHLSDPDYFIDRSAVYETKPFVFSKDLFSVFVGNTKYKPFILEDVEDKIKEQILEEYSSLEEFEEKNVIYITRPPRELKKFYTEDLNLSLMRLSGFSTSVNDSFIKEAAVLKSIESKWTNPCTVPMPLLGIYDMTSIDELLPEDKLLEDYEGELVYIHYDASRTGDYTGFGSSYYSQKYQCIRPLWSSAIYYDFRISDNEVDTVKLVSILRYFLSLGVNIGYVSADGYASTYILQQAKLLLGPEKAGHFSVDDNSGAYVNLINLIKLGRYKQYPYDEYVWDLPRLILDKVSNKVDHAFNANESVRSFDFKAKFRKDYTDGVAGSVFHCSVREQHTFEEETLENKMKNYSENVGYYDEVSTDEADFYGNISSDGAYDDLEDDNDVSDPLNLSRSLR